MKYPCYICITLARTVGSLMLVVREGTWNTQVLLWVVKCQLNMKWKQMLVAKFQTFMTSIQWQTENCWNLSSSRI